MEDEGGAPQQQEENNNTSPEINVKRHDNRPMAQAAKAPVKD